jgi:hypothetical protein
VAARRKELLVNEKQSNRQRRFLLWSALGAVAIVAAGGGAWILSLPPAPTLTAAPPIAKREADAALTALKPPKRQRPLIAIIGINDATEVTDYLMPYGILRRSDVADVVALATKPGDAQALSGAQGRAAGDCRGVRGAASGRR